MSEELKEEVYLVEDETDLEKVAKYIYELQDGNDTYKPTKLVNLAEQGKEEIIKKLKSDVDQLPDQLNIYKDNRANINFIN